MYLSFYGLREKPFNTTPDPKFLFLTAGHREALAQLVYGVQEAKGFIVLSAEIGTGKTTLLHALLRQLDGSNTAVAYIFNSTLGFDGYFADVITVVEWGRIVAEEFADYLAIDLDFTDEADTVRTLTFACAGERWAPAMTTLRARIAERPA